MKRGGGFLRLFDFEEIREHDQPSFFEYEIMLYNVFGKNFFFFHSPIYRKNQNCLH